LGQQRDGTLDGQSLKRTADLADLAHFVRLDLGDPHPTVRLEHH
jgi:hypothetical protein